MPSLPPMPRGYRRELGDYCSRFLEAHPHYERNVFIMTRFAPGDPLLRELDEELRRALRWRGLNGVRADDAIYHDQLWQNVCVYMLCCASGVAVLEDRSANEFNPNVALEYGFMRALEKPTLLLKDKAFRNARADILGTIHGEFDIARIGETLTGAIDQWAKDRNLALRPGSSQLELRAFGIYEHLLKIDGARYLHDPARKRRELDDEFHYLGEQVFAYEQLLAVHADADHAGAVAEARLRLVEPATRDLGALPALVERFAALSRRAR